MADFRGRASKAQDESETIYSARKEMHSEPDRSMINGHSSQFKDAPLTNLGKTEIAQYMKIVTILEFISTIISCYIRG